MELRELRAFAAVAHRRHFRHAADDLNLAQPALTRAIQRIEHELGASLFERTTRQVHLTPAGELFLVYVERILSEIHQATSQVRDGAVTPDPHARISLGIDSSLGFAALHLPQILNGFHAQHPETRVRVNIGDARELMRELLKRSVDVALVDMTRAGEAPGGVQFRRLFADELVLLTPTSHPLAASKSVPLAAAHGQKLIRFSAGPAIRQTLLRARCLELAVTPDFAYETDDSQTLRDLVSSGLGLAIAPPWAGASENRAVRLVPIDPPTLTWDLRLAWTEHARRRAAVNTFLEFAWDPLHAVFQSPTT